ncbi:flagellar export chaperone FliS [Candidatus Sumerlaeota bacterium]|nr:flagellar export chaperone FliS [Candidatus Sumerlaeota bacterium]
MAPYYSQAYLSTHIETADRMSLVVTLYEAALANVTQAMEAIESGDSAAKSKSIERASKILMGLCEALDYTQDNGLSGRLFALYTFQLRQLLEANRTDDVEPLQMVKSTLTILLEGWETVSRSPEGIAMRTRETSDRALSRSPKGVPTANRAMALMA